MKITQNQNRNILFQIQNERFSDWSPVLIQLRKIFTTYKNSILDYHKTGNPEEDEAIPKGNENNQTINSNHTKYLLFQQFDAMKSARKQTGILLVEINFKFVSIG
jgi:hypothetical protein